MKNNRHRQGLARTVAALPRGQSGTTLLELMFAMIIFGTLLTIMAIFPSAAAKSVKSVSDMRAAIIGKSIRDSIKVSMETAYRADDSDTSPILITIVHDGLFAEDDYDTGEPAEGEDTSSTAGVLTIQLPKTATLLDISAQEQQIAVRADMRIVPDGEEPNEEPDEEDEEEAEEEINVKGFLLAYTDNTLVRYPTTTGKVYKLARYLRDKDSELYNKYDNLDDYSFDIEVRQAVRERRPKDADGNIIYNTKLRVYDLIPNVYEFHIRIYYGWKPLSTTARAKGMENPALVHQFSFIASVPELEMEDD